MDDSPSDEQTVAKQRRQTEIEKDLTFETVTVACLGGVCTLFMAILVYDAATDWGAASLSWLPPWRAHMAVACAGITGYTVSLFFLVKLARKSKVLAWRSTTLWLPLIALTLLATLFHFPVYAVAVAGVIGSVWAYRRTRAVH